MHEPLSQQLERSLTIPGPAIQATRLATAPDRGNPPAPLDRGAAGAPARHAAPKPRGLWLSGAALGPWKGCCRHSPGVWRPGIINYGGFHSDVWRMCMENACPPGKTAVDPIHLLGNRHRRHTPCGVPDAALLPDYRRHSGTHPTLAPKAICFRTMR
jgi:hypothetical protein